MVYARRFEGSMQIGSIVKWKYSKDKLFIVVTMVENPFMDGASVGVKSVKSLVTHDMFVSDLEVVCE
jgi:hypothetical protein